MPQFIPEEIINDILDRIDIVELISGYIPLKLAGRNFKALCPFHHEKTPSFMVSPTRQIYHCFGCNAGGNAYSFLMKYERLEFPEAVEMLAKKVGVALPVVSLENSLKESNLSKQLYQANELASIYYHRLLETEEGKRGLFYLRKRGLKDETIAKFKLGYAHSAWDGLLSFARSKGFKLEILERAGLIIPREGGGHFDRFRDRIIFPIFELKDKVIGFGGRALDKETPPKYMNSPETGIYSKGRHLYGLNFALEHIRQIDFVIIVEGYLDLITPHQFGLKNIVSSLGTALTTEQIRLLKRYTKNVVMVYDADQAGEAASLRGLDMLIEEGLNIKVVSLPQGFDPDDYVRQKGISNFQEEIKAGRDLFDYKLNLLVTKYNPSALENKIKIINEMLPTISKVENAILESCYIKRLSESLSVAEESLLIEIRKVKKLKTYRNLSLTDEDKASFVKLDVKPAEKFILRLMLEDNEFIRECRERLTPADFQSPNAREIVEALFEFNSQNKKISPNKLINYFQDDRTSQLVSKLITFDEEIIDRRKTFEDCIKRVKKDGREIRLKTIGDEIKSMQTSKDEARLEKLMAESNRLIKQKARD